MSEYRNTPSPKNVTLEIQNLQKLNTKFEYFQTFKGRVEFARHDTIRFTRLSVLLVKKTVLFGSKRARQLVPLPPLKKIVENGERRDRGCLFV
jgi:hypothetical protein